MTKERFIEILKEYEYSDAQIDNLWDGRPDDEEINEDKLREAAQATSPLAEATRRESLHAEYKERY